MNLFFLFLFQRKAIRRTGRGIEFSDPSKPSSLEKLSMVSLSSHEPREAVMIPP